MTEKDINMSYEKNKKHLIILLATVSLPPNFSDKERRMQLKGVLPKDWNCHHLRCKFLNGGNEIENLSIIEKWNHRCLHDSLNHILDAQSELYGVDMEFMEGYAKKFGAYTLNDYKAKAKTNNVPTLRTLKNKKRKQIRLEI